MSKITGLQISGVWAAWTPSVVPNSGSFGSTSASGRFTQIGNTVFFNATITLTTVSTGSGVQFSLPITAQGAGPVIGGWREVVTAGFTGTVYLSSTTLGFLHEYDNSQTLANGNSFRVYGTYEAA